MREAAIFILPRRSWTRPKPSAKRFKQAYRPFVAALPVRRLYPVYEIALPSVSIWIFPAR
jgi:hypothetical protein